MRIVLLLYDRSELCYCYTTDEICVTVIRQMRIVLLLYYKVELCYCYTTDENCVAVILQMRIVMLDIGSFRAMMK